MAKIVARLSGIVAYADGDKAQFAGLLDHAGNVSYNGKPVAAGGTANQDSAKAMAEVHADYAWLDTSNSGLFSLIPHLSFGPVAGAGDLPAGWTPAHSVKSMVADFMVRVTLDTADLQQGKPTWEEYHVSFFCQHQDDGTIIGAFKDTKTAPAVGANSTTPWAKIYASTSLKAALAALFTPLGITIT